MKKNILFLICTLFYGQQAVAAQVRECGFEAQIRNIVEPLKVSTRTFSNGNIRIWHVDTGGEPVCCSSHLIIIAPDPEDELGGMQCKLISNADELGFVDISVPGITSRYSPSKGLLLSVPVRYYNPDPDGKKLHDTFNVRINQKSGSITIE